VTREVERDKGRREKKKRREECLIETTNKQKID
jgi:hypothetical protein